MLNKYPLWKNLLLIAVLVFGFIYAAPNLYVEDPAVQISMPPNPSVGEARILYVKTKAVLDSAKLPIKDFAISKQEVLIRFYDTDTQLQAKDLLKASLGDDYTVAVNLASSTPNWLSTIGAHPMKLGLDLRGGVQFTLEVDIDSVIKQRLEAVSKNVSDTLRNANIRYAAVVPQKQGVLIGFRDRDNLVNALPLLQRQLPEIEFVENSQGDRYQLVGAWTQQGLNTIRQNAIDKTMTTLRNRVNELGVAEPVVQQQGANRIVVELPGIQDTVRAQQILGGTATLEFRLVDLVHDPRTALATGVTPIGSKLYRNTFSEQPILLQDQVVLTGNSITDAAASFGEDGRPSVSISLGGGGESYFHRITGQNVGKPLAIVYVETRVQSQTINGKTVLIPKKVERVISAPIIQTALPSTFEITGLNDADNSRNLALMLRSGALPATIYVVESRTIGPQLGAENIHRGVISIIIGFILAITFMALYYQVFGLIADIALAMNLVLLVAVLSLLGMTLTLPGMAGIVLTVGMAVDANVLIFERIREELRNGASPQASIHAGYERALATIIDANVTTLIAALVLFGIGTGPVKGFAVTLSLGLITSMLTGLMFGRALINWIFGGRPVKKLPIGI